jgi:sulfur-carrier protein
VETDRRGIAADRLCEGCVTGLASCRESGRARWKRRRDTVSVEAAGRAEEEADDEKALVPITFHISSALRPFAGGRDRVEIAGTPATAGDALEALWAVCPALRDRVATEEGEIREHVNLFVGQENVRYTGGLTTPVAADAELSIFPAISGG